MTTPLIVRDSVIMDRLLGHDVKSITVEGTKFYIVHSVFKHFGRGSSQSFKDEFCQQFPGLRNHVVTYPKLREYCLRATTQSRVAHAKFMLLIAAHEQPALEVPSPGVNEGLVKIPYINTVQGQQIVALAKEIGMGNLHAVLSDAGMLKDIRSLIVPATESGVKEGEQVIQPLRKVVVTIEY